MRVLLKKQAAAPRSLVGSSSDTSSEDYGSMGLTQLDTDKRPELARRTRILLSAGYLPIASSSRTSKEILLTCTMTPGPFPPRHRTRTESPSRRMLSNSACDIIPGFSDMDLFIPSDISLQSFITKILQAEDQKRIFEPG
jgi:hypothetical protein